uniref:Carbonic anhydrase 11 n=1 Tax=Myotis myotis TaxID=51298 RepID=A0A7J7QXD4_MYOMY|nr:carbonic anhydrase 11 [Myotis myotis]
MWMVPPTVAEAPHRGLRLPFPTLPKRGGESPPKQSY